MRNCTFLLLLAVCLSSMGCVALAVGGGAATGLAYAAGAMQRTYSHQIDVVWAATLAALDELELPKGYQVKDQLKGKIERHTATGDRIEIKLTNRGAFTDLSLRVNTFGSKPMSLAIIHKIDEYLPQDADATEPLPDSAVTELPFQHQTEPDTELSFPNTPDALPNSPALQ